MPIESEIAPAAGDDTESNLSDLPAPSVPATKRWMPFARMVIVVVVFAGLAMAAHRSIEHWNSQPEGERLQLNDLHAGWLLAGACLYAVSLLPAAAVLARALRSLGIRSRMRMTMSAQLIGHLAKYVPGKAMVIIVRADVLNRGGSDVSLRAATIAISIETLTMIATGATFAVVTLMLVDQSVWGLPDWIRQTSLLMAIAAIVGTLPAVLRLVMSRRMIGGSLPFSWTMKDVVAAWLWNSLAWVLIGASTTAIVLAVPEPIRSGTVPSVWGLFVVCLAAIALAYVAGFLSLLPGGAGVRELVLTTLLAPIAAESGAFLIAIMLRMTHLIVEGILASGAWIAFRSFGQNAPDVDVPVTSD